MGRGRPGGNPELKKHQFQTAEGKEPNNVKLSLWITQSMMDALKELGKTEDKNQFVRDAIAAALKQHKGVSQPEAEG